MNTLAPAGENQWKLPAHAHVIVSKPSPETPNPAESQSNESPDSEVSPARGGLLTIYDCGAAQKPPAAQLLGTLVNIEAEHELVEQPTGYILKLREGALLECQADNHWVIRADKREHSAAST